MFYTSDDNLLDSAHLFFNGTRKDKMSASTVLFDILSPQRSTDIHTRGALRVI